MKNVVDTNSSSDFYCYRLRADESHDFQPLTARATGCVFKMAHRLRATKVDQPPSLRIFRFISLRSTNRKKLCIRQNAEFCIFDFLLYFDLCCICPKLCIRKCRVSKHHFCRTDSKITCTCRWFEKRGLNRPPYTKINLRCSNLWGSDLSNSGTGDMR